MVCFQSRYERKQKNPKKKKRPIARENSPLVRSFLPWLVCCTRVILVALSNNTEILHEILVCWIWPLGPHKNNNNNNFFCKSATTSSTSADKHASTKSPFYHHPTPFVIPVILPWHFDLIPISNFFGGEGGEGGGTLEGRQELLLLLKEEAQRSGVSAVCQWAFKPNDKNIEAWCNKESGLWVQDLGFKPGGRYKVYSPCPCTYLLRLSRTKRILTVFVVKGAFFSPFCFQHKKKLPLLYFILF